MQLKMSKCSKQNFADCLASHRVITNIKFKKTPTKTHK